MRNRSMFVSLVSILVAVYIGMWIFVGINPRAVFAPDTKVLIGKEATVLLEGGTVINGTYEGRDDNWLYLKDGEAIWVPLAQVESVRFK